jgi:large subunit ribosomal protein L21
MKLAVIKTGGKQYKVQAGEKLKIEKIEAKEGEILNFPVLLIAEDEKIHLGQPLLSETVEAKVVEQGRAKKVHVIKFKNKTRYKKNVGHRQPFTKIEIVKI